MPVTNSVIPDFDLYGVSHWQIASTAEALKSRGQYGIAKYFRNGGEKRPRNLLRKAASNRLTTVFRGLYERGNCVRGGISGFVHTASACPKERLSGWLDRLVALRLSLYLLSSNAALSARQPSQIG